MKTIDISKHTKYSLELIFSEADKLATQILSSISENRNKSFFLFAFIASLISFSFIKITESDFNYLILLIGGAFSCVLLRKNLFPQTIGFRGALPENLIISYFDKFKDDDLNKEYLATQIQSYNDAMNHNKEEMIAMVKRFKNAALFMFFTFIIFGIAFLIGFIECLPT